MSTSNSFWVLNYSFNFKISLRKVNC